MCTKTVALIYTYCIYYYPSYVLKLRDGNSVVDDKS